MDLHGIGLPLVSKIMSPLMEPVMYMPLPTPLPSYRQGLNSLPWYMCFLCDCLAVGLFLLGPAIMHYISIFAKF